jgi:hypothetical protein
MQNKTVYPTSAKAHQLTDHAVDVASALTGQATGIAFESDDSSHYLAGFNDGVSAMTLRSTE